MSKIKCKIKLYKFLISNGCDIRAALSIVRSAVILHGNLVQR